MSVGKHGIVKHDIHLLCVPLSVLPTLLIHVQHADQLLDPSYRCSSACRVRVRVFQLQTMTGLTWQAALHPPAKPQCDGMSWCSFERLLWLRMGVCAAVKPTLAVKAISIAVLRSCEGRPGHQSVTKQLAPVGTV